MVVSRMNKKGLQFKDAFFSIIGFSLIIIAVGLIITNWSDAYGSGVSSDLGEYNKLSDLSETATGQKGVLSPNDPDPSQDAEANTFKGVYGIITGTFSSFDLVFGSDGMLQSVKDRFHIPNYIIQAIITFMLFSITFAIIAIVFRLSRSTA